MVCRPVKEWKSDGVAAKISGTYLCPEKTTDETLKLSVITMRKENKEMLRLKTAGLATMVILFTIFSLCMEESLAVEIENLEGSQFVSVFGNINNTSIDSSDVTVTLIGGSFGKFIKENMEITGSLTLVNVNYDDSDGTIYNLFGKFNYNFIRPGSTNIPYAGGALGLTGYDTGGYSDTSLTIGFQGGFKNFISEDVSLNVEGSFMRSEIDGASADSLSVTVGISYYF